jgi:hypothetical protein
VLSSPATHFSVVAPATVTAGTPFGFTITALDAFNHVVTGYGGTVHFTASAGSNALPADYTFTAGDAGVHAFSGATLGIAGTETLTAKDKSNSTITGMAAVRVNPGAVTHFGVSAPATTLDGAAFAVTVSALDAYGNTVTGYAGTVHFSSTDPSAVLPANYTFTATDAGKHTFPAVTLVTTGPRTVTATDTGAPSVTGGASVTVTPRAATHLLVLAPANATAGVPFAFTVEALDAYNNVATGYTGTVHFIASAGSNSLPANYTFTGGDAGVHAFSATLGVPGTETLTATDTVNGSITGTASIRVAPAVAAAQFAVLAPASATAGTPFSITVEALDAHGNVVSGYGGTVHFTASAGSNVLPLDYTFTPGDAGVHTFTNGVTLGIAGTETLTATDTSAPSVTGAASVRVTAGAATQLAVLAPATATAGTPFIITVEAFDAYGNTATGYTGTAHFTASAGYSTLPADYTFTAADAGVHVFGVTLGIAGTETITATDTANVSLTATASVRVSPGPVTQLDVSAPDTAIAGGPFSVWVNAEDDYGNIVPGYTGTVHFTSTDPLATLPADYTFTAADQGAHTFTGVALEALDIQTITATDTGNPSLFGGTEVDVLADPPATHYAVIAPATATVGTPFSITVDALDADGNVATGYTGTAHFTASAGSNTLPLDYTFTAGDNGIHTFTGVVLGVPGTETITANDTADSTITGVASIRVASAAVTHYAVIAPVNATAGTPFTITVEALDQNGSVVTGYGGTVHFTASAGSSTLPLDYTFTAADNGVHTFTNGVTLGIAGTETLTATDTANGSVTGAASVRVAAGPVTHLGLSAPATATAGVPFSVTLAALDAYGNDVSGYTGTVTFTCSAGSQVLPANYTFTAADGGLHTFSGVTLGIAGTEKVTATDTSNPSLTSSVSVRVSPGAVTHFAVSGPASAAPNTPISVTVTALDQFGNTVTGYAGTVHFSSSDLFAGLPANYTFTAADGGKHTFTVVLRTVGVRTIAVADVANAGILGSTSVTVGAGGFGATAAADPGTAGLGDTPAGLDAFFTQVGSQKKEFDGV